MQYLQIKNWEQFQQYKDRSPKWIKVHRDLLRDYEFGKLPDKLKAQLLLIWLLAAETDNKIPNDPDWIKSQTQMTEKPNIEQLLTSGFLLLYDSVQDCTDVYKNVPRDREETETEERERQTFLIDFLKSQGLPKEKYNEIETWIPDDFLTLYEEEVGNDNLEVEWKKFCNWFTSSNAKRKKYIDWKATWRNWILK